MKGLNNQKWFFDKKVLYGLLGLGTVFIILCIALYSCRIYPFGDKTLVYNDMQYQYLDFFIWFRNVLHGQDSLTYSFSAGLGSNTIALFAYYLASPFNLLVYFVNADQMAQFLTLLIVLKLILCSLTMYIFLQIRFHNASFYSTIFSIGYALMGYNLLQCSNIMWLDGVIILPIVALGIYKCVWKKTHVCYFLSLAYAVFSNWYIGYMICLFSVLYFLIEMVLYYNKITVKKVQVLKDTAAYIASSLLAVMTTSILFVPQVLQMSGTGEGFDWSVLVPGFGFSYLEGFRDLFLNTDKLTLSEGNPPVFAGGFVLIWIAVIFCSKKIDRMKKYLSAAILCGGMLVFDFKPLNYIFTAFKIPSSHTYRYAFIFSFFMIFIGALCIFYLKKVTKDEIRNAVLAIVGILFVSEYIKPYNSRELLYLDGIFIVLMAIGVFLRQKNNKKIIFAASILILGCTVLEFSVKAKGEFEDHIQSASAYGEYNRNMQDLVEGLKEQDPEVYRIDKTFSRTGEDICNTESMAFGYSAISQYSSTNNVNVAQMLNCMGNGTDTTITPYHPILPVDSLLGIKYVFSGSQAAGYNLLEENVMDGISLYENPYALPLGFTVESEQPLDMSADVFTNQELLYGNILGENVELYADNIVEEYQTDSYSWSEWKVRIVDDGPLYLYFSNGNQGMEIWVNGEFKSKNSWYDNSIRYVGDYQKGDIITIRVQADEGYYQEDYGILAETLNMDNFENVIQRIRENACNITYMNDNKVSASVTCEKDTMLMLTIPFEKGWSVRINGEKESCEQINGAFMGIELSAGENIIEMQFEVPGLKAGIAMTCLGLLGFIIWKGGIRYYRKNRKQQGISNRSN